MLTIGSLFSGIGGLELGLEWAGLGPVIWQVEIDPFCQSVLAKHWPGVPIYGDIKTLDGSRIERPDVLAGGFPCQDVSSAGKGAGLAGSRSGLWREFARIVGAVKPAWVVVENVASGANRWVDTVVRDLEERGYDALPFPLSAADVGAPHLRRRIFVVAHTNNKSESVGAVDAQMARVCGDTGHAADANSIECEGERGKHQRRRKTEKGSRWDGIKGFAPNSERVDLRQQSRRRGGEDGTGEGKSGKLGAQGEAAYAEGESLRSPGQPWDPPRWRGRIPQPAIRRMDDGLSSVVGRRSSTASLRGAGKRREQLRALGNAVVPQCAEVIGWIIRELVDPRSARVPGVKA